MADPLSLVGQKVGKLLGSFFFFFFNIYLVVLGLSCGTWDLLVAACAI